MKSEDCRAYVIKCSSEQKLGELSQKIDVSKTALSLYAHGKYKSNAQAIEKKIAAYVSRSSISFKDERRLLAIYAILDESDNRESIIAAIAHR